MKVNDFNGEGDWSLERVRERYSAYCGEYGVANIRDLTPMMHSKGNQEWVYPILGEVIRGIEDGDAACVALGVDLIEEDTLFPFGKTLKSNTARALRRAQLTEQLKSRLRKRLVYMLIAGIIPHEFREYSKLLRTIGVAEFWPELHACIPRDNPYAMRFYEALLQNDASQVLPHNPPGDTI
jgi:hypothetical protein